VHQTYMIDMSVVSQISK